MPNKPVAPKSTSIATEAQLKELSFQLEDFWKSIDDRLDRLEARIQALEQALRDDRGKATTNENHLEDLHDMVVRMARHVSPWVFQENCPKCGRKMPKGKCKYCMD